MLRVTVRECSDFTFCVVNGPLFHITLNPPPAQDLISFVPFSQTENSLSSGCFFPQLPQFPKVFPLPPLLYLNFSLLSIHSLFLSRAAAVSKITNIQSDNIQLCLLNNNGIMLLNPEDLKNSNGYGSKCLHQPY